MRETLCLILCLMFFPVCGSKQKNVERVIEDGVEVIINHLEPYKTKKEPSSVYLEKVFTIDTEENDIAAVGLTEIYDFDVDSTGKIYCLNLRGDENNIYVFDANGDYITSFGRKGQGPGEFQFAMNINISKDDEIVVIDPRIGRLILLNTKGVLIKDSSIPISYGYAILLNNGNYLIYGQQTRVGSDMFSFSLLNNSELKKIKELDRQDFPRTHLGEKRKATPYRFIPGVSEETIYVGNPERGYEIWQFDFEGNLLRKIKKEYIPLRISDEFKSNYWKRYDPSRLSTQKKKVYMPDNMPPYQYIFSDDEGRLFVMTYEKGASPKEYRYDIFNKNGIYIGGMNLDNYGESYPLTARSRKNFLYCMREKESGFKELVVYRTKWE